MSVQDIASSGVALWRLVADGIERGIAEGRFAAGEKLPGEMEIAEIYRVNRHTVRRALAALADRGLVRAERGSGTYVEVQRIAYPLRSRTRFSEIVGAGGREPRGQLIEASDDVASRELAKELRLKIGTPLIRIESLRLADRAPICVATSWFSAERFPGAGEVYANLRSMTKLLEHFGVRDYRRASTRITAGIVDATDAARLNLALGRPILIADATDVGPDGTPLTTKRSRFAAERVEFLVENS
jgi:GntR family transcriptional regulator, phosphonate transport system regulatory protein